MLKLNKLEGEGCFSLGYFKLEFTPGLNLILGHSHDDASGNESGKTNLISTINQMLFMVNTKKNNLINWNQATGFLGELDFETGGESWTLRQAFDHHQHKTTLELWKGQEEVTTGKLPSRKQILKSHEPMTYDEWCCLCYLNADSLHPFIESKRAGKRDLLNAIYSLDYMKWFKHASKECAETKKALEAVLNNRVGSIQSLQEQLKATGTPDKLSAKRDKLQSRRDAALSKKKKIEDEYAASLEISKYLEEVHVLSQELKKLRKKNLRETKVIQEDIDKANTRITDLTTNKSKAERLQTIKNTLADLPDLSSDTLENLQEQVESLQRKRDLLRSISEAKDEYTEALGVHESVDVFSIDYEKELPLAQEELVELTTLATHVDTRESLEDRLKKAKAGLAELPDVGDTEDITSELESLTSSAAVLELEKEQLEKKITQVEKGVCPTCDRAWDNPEKEIRVLQKKLSKVTSALEDASENIPKLKDKRKVSISRSKVLADIEGLEDTLSRKYSDIIGTTESVAQQIHTCKKKIKDLGILETYSKLLKSEKYCAKIQKGLSLVSKLPKVIDAIKEAKHKSSNMNRYLTLKEEEGALLAEGIQSLDMYTTKLAKTSALLDDLRTEIKDSQIFSKKTERYKELDAYLDRDLPDIMDTKERLDDITAKYETLSNDLAEVSTKITYSKELVASIDKLKDSTKEVQLLENKLKVLDGVKYAFSEEGLVQLRYKKIFKELNSILSEYIKILFIGKRKFTAELVPDGKDIHVSISCSGKKGIRPEGLSSSQKNRIGLAIMFAMRDYCPSSKKSNVLLLDEVDKSHHEKNQERVLQAIRYHVDKQNRVNASAGLPSLSVWVVAHQPTIRDSSVWDRKVTCVLKKGVTEVLDGDYLPSAG